MMNYEYSIYCKWFTDTLPMAWVVDHIKQHIPYIIDIDLLFMAVSLVLR